MIIRLVNQAFKIKKLRAENKRLKEELDQSKLVIQYLNSCVSKANRRYIELLKSYGLYPNTLELLNKCENLDFPNSQLEGQMSISEILET